MGSNKADTTETELTIQLPGAAEVQAAIEGTNKANPSEADKRALAAIFEKHPDIAQIVGNLSRQFRKKRVESLGPSYFLRESILVTMDAMQRDLGYDQAPMASRLVIDQVITCWLDLADVQRRHAVALAGEHTLMEGQYWDERLTRSQGRYLRALETLARVNRLAKVVPIQVNIAAQGGQQVNVAKVAEG